MLTDVQLRALKPTGKVFKVSDQQGLYAAVTRTGTISFRFDYRIHGRRETLVIGKYDATRAGKALREDGELSYGLSITLAEARHLLARAHRAVEKGESPSRGKVDRRREAADALTFGAWATKYLAESTLAESTRAMRRSVYERNLEKEFGRLKLEEITPARVLDRCERIKERGVAAPAVQAREIVLLVYRFVQARGLKIENPAEGIRPSAIATFKPRDRALSPAELRVFFKALEHVATLPTLRLAVKFMLLTMVRKSEFIHATWDEVDFGSAVWSVPKERMKAGRPHNVYLSHQALDILIAFKTCFSTSAYLHPGRYETKVPISAATLNRVIEATVTLIQVSDPTFEPFTVHDLRRTASTLLHEAGFNSDWIEKCLSHEQKGVRAVYNKAEYADQRRRMLQAWADMLEGWIQSDAPVLRVVSTDIYGGAVRSSSGEVLATRASAAG